jgi:hypothetical protein
MSYKRRKPVREKEMLKERWTGHHTVCETLREIYQLADDNDYQHYGFLEDIKLKCRLAMAMAKAMQEKLKKYKKEQHGRYK